MAVSDRELDWAAWMIAGRAGDATAYRRLLEALAPVLRGRARHALARCGRSVDEAEDVVQETLLAIHLKRHTWRSEEPIGPWIDAIARYKLIDLLRRGGRGAVSIDDVEHQLVDADDPVESVGRRQAERFVDALGGTRAAVVRALTIEGVGVRETAKRLGMSEGAVRVALHRGLAALAKLYRSDP